jgi:hypothetical protein
MASATQAHLISAPPGGATSTPGQAPAPRRLVARHAQAMGSPRRPDSEAPREVLFAPYRGEVPDSLDRLVTAERFPGRAAPASRTTAPGHVINRIPCVSAIASRLLDRPSIGGSKWDLHAGSGLVVVQSGPCQFPAQYLLIGCADIATPRGFSDPKSPDAVTESTAPRRIR